MLGAGAWGTALAVHTSARHQVSLWARDAAQCALMRSQRENERYLPGIALPASLAIEHFDAAAWARQAAQGDLFIGPEEFSDPLLKEGKLLTGSRTAFARSSTGLAVRAGAPKPDISSPEKLKRALLAAGAVSYSTGASGMHFVKVLERLGIADVIAAKRIAPRAGELVGAVVARGDADIAVQQISELLPVPGIDILDPLPAEFQQTISYGATAFPQSTQREAAQAFVNFLRSAAARAVLREKGLDPA